MSDQTNVKLRLNNSELWGGLIGLALGVFVVWSGLKLKLGTINDPGSGYVLFYTGILMCMFAVAIIIAAVTEGGPTFGARWKDARWTKPVLVIASLIAFSFAALRPRARVIRPFGCRVPRAALSFGLTVDACAAEEAEAPGSRPG